MSSYAFACREASTMAYADAFRAIMAASVATPLVLLKREVAAPAKPPQMRIENLLAKQGSQN